MTDCTCTTPKPREDSTCERCHGFACAYADRGRTRCPRSRCDCFIDQYPDDPMGLHPEAFQVGGFDRD